MRYVLAGEKDLEKGPVNGILENFPDAKIMVFSPPSEVVFEEEMEMIRKKISPGDTLICFCFPGTYASKISGEFSSILIDPPSGVEDSVGNVLELQPSDSTIITSEISGIDSVERVFDCGHWFSDSEGELLEEVKRFVSEGS